MADPATAALTARERELVDAAARHDDARVAQMVATEFRLTGPDESFAIPRDAWLANLATMTWDDYRLDDVSVHVLGHTALVTSKHTIRNWKTPRGTIPLAVSYVTDVWFEREGRWQLSNRTAEAADQPPRPDEAHLRDTATPAAVAPKIRFYFEIFRSAGALNGTCASCAPSSSCCWHSARLRSR